MDPVLGGRYALGARVGSGGMAQVFAARDRVLERDVAVKVLRSGLSDQRARQRFEHEARHAAAFVHPNAVTVYDVGEDGYRPFLVMELVNGCDLATRLAERGPLPVAEARRIADAMLDALAAAHHHGLVHRDVKPGNVLIADDGTVKLADFGIAKATADATGDLTPTDQVLGTPKYLSPEQVAGERATPRSDLYAVGVVLYEMLTGTAPFTGDSPVAIALAHQRTPVPPLRARAPDVPRSVAAVVERALAKDPAARFGSATEMRKALDAARAEPVAPPTMPLAVTQVLDRPTPSPPERPRRARVLVPAVLGAVLLAVAAIGFAASRDGGEPPSTFGEQAGSTDTTTTTAASSSTLPPTTATPPTSAVPGSIPALLAALQVDPRSFGSKGPALFDALDRVQRGEDVDTSKLAEDIDRWIDKGQLDLQVGAAARQIVLLAGGTESDDDNRGPGNGNGNGRGGGEED